MTWLSNLCGTLLNTTTPEEEGTDYAVRVAVMAQVLQGKGLDVIPLWRSLCIPERGNKHLQVGSLSIGGEIVAFDGGFGWDAIATAVLESLNVENIPGAYHWVNPPSGELAILALHNAGKNPQKAASVERFRGWCEAQVDQQMLEQQTTEVLALSPSPRL